jgi:hypothetical protein
MRLSHTELEFRPGQGGGARTFLSAAMICAGKPQQLPDGLALWKLRRTGISALRQADARFAGSEARQALQFPDALSDLPPSDPGRAS